MDKLSDAIPEEEISSPFKNVQKKIIASSMSDIKNYRAKDVAAISLFIWDEMVHRGIAKEPFKIAPIINNDFKGIYEFVTKEFGCEPVTDAYAVSYFNELDSEYSFVDATLVQCFPEDIHIADVEFADNRKPLKGKSASKGVRSFHGLHVFSDFISRLKIIAKARDAKRLSLMVADSDLYPVFKRHGFVVSDTQMAQMAFNGPRMGFPMILPV